MLSFSTGEAQLAQSSFVSASNSSTSTLTASSAFTGTAESTLAYSAITVSVFANVASAASGLSIQQSSNGTNWDHVDTYTVRASAGMDVTVQLVASHVRVVYTNGGTNQATFRLQSVLHAVTRGGSIGPIRGIATLWQTPTRRATRIHSPVMNGNITSDPNKPLTAPVIYGSYRVSSGQFVINSNLTAVLGIYSQTPGTAQTAIFIKNVTLMRIDTGSITAVNRFVGRRSTTAGTGTGTLLTPIACSSGAPAATAQVRQAPTSGVIGVPLTESLFLPQLISAANNVGVSRYNLFHESKHSQYGMILNPVDGLVITVNSLSNATVGYCFDISWDEGPRVD